MGTGVGASKVRVALLRMYKTGPGLVIWIMFE